MTRHALKAPEIVTELSRLDQWKLSGDGEELSIEKTWDFDNYYQTMSFVNAVAHVANQRDHHPELNVSYKRCVVRYRTHDVGGLTITDFECAALVDALL
jgi:4a-hydroxytetrahydrobiopterin dehydratase